MIRQQATRMIPTIVLPISIINSIPIAIQNKISPRTRLTLSLLKLFVTVYAVNAFYIIIFLPGKRYQQLPHLSGRRLFSL